MAENLEKLSATTGHVHLAHPLTALVWEQNGGRLNLDPVARWKCAVLHEKIFVTVEDISVTNIRYSPQEQVDSKGLSAYYAPIANLSSWTPFSPPDVRAFALTTYNSQLVMVGGWTAGKKILNTLWASADGTNWQKNLPPMPTSRYGAAAVNTGTSVGPECLVVAGGIQLPEINIDTVEVLVEGQWSTVHYLPEPHDFLCYFVYHNGGLYLGGGLTMFYCQLHSLLATSRGGKSSSPWKTMPTPSTFDLVSYQGHLVSFDYKVHAYCPLQQSWVHVETIDDEFKRATVGPAGQLIVLSYDSAFAMKIREATFMVSPYDADSVLSEDALCRLELAEVPVVTSLAKVPDQLAEAIGTSLTDGCGWEDAVDLWVYGHRNWASQRPPTWRSLYEVLGELNLERLSQQIEDYFCCPQSLKEQCLSVILRALLQHSSLEPDQLPVRLPDYVPPTVKHSLTHSFKAHTNQLPPPTVLSVFPRV